MSKELDDFLTSDEPLAEASGVNADYSQCEIVGDRALGEKIVQALTTIFDPEIPVNIYDLGLIYKLDIDEHNFVKVDMTLTTPGCPVAQTFPGQVEAVVADVEGVSDAEVVLVWDPPWTMERMSEGARLELGMF